MMRFSRALPLHRVGPQLSSTPPGVQPPAVPAKNGATLGGTSAILNQTRGVEKLRGGALHAAPKGGATLPSVAFLGFGAMASAMARGVDGSERPFFSKYVICDPDTRCCNRATKLLSAAPVSISKSAKEAVELADVVVLGVKPQSLPPLLKTLPLTERHLVVSLVAGWSIDRLVHALCEEASSRQKPPRVIRTMPNAPLQVGKGATLFSRCARCTTHDVRLVDRVFSSCGITAELPEEQLDAATGLSGSGPSYVAVFLEALADGAVQQGLPRDLAVRFAAQTVEGAAAMCSETADESDRLHPSILKERICSPGGTSIYGVAALENHGMRRAVMAAVEAAANRSRALRTG